MTLFRKLHICRANGEVNAGSADMQERILFYPSGNSIFPAIPPPTIRRGAPRHSRCATTRPAPELPTREHIAPTDAPGRADIPGTGARRVRWRLAGDRSPAVQVLPPGGERPIAGTPGRPERPPAGAGRFFLVLESPRHASNLPPNRPNASPRVVFVIPGASFPAINPLWR